MRKPLTLILTAAGIMTLSSCGCAGLFALEFVTDPAGTIVGVGELVGEEVGDLFEGEDAQLSEGETQELGSKPKPSPGLK